MVNLFQAYELSVVRYIKNVRSYSDVQKKNLRVLIVPMSTNCPVARWVVLADQCKEEMITVCIQAKLEPKSSFTRIQKYITHTLINEI